MEERLAWRETRTCGILRTAEDLTDFIFCPRLQLSLGLPALQENFHNFQKVTKLQNNVSYIEALYMSLLVHYPADWCVNV